MLFQNKSYLTGLLALFVLMGCAPQVKDVPDSVIPVNSSKNIFVLFDGTRNDPESGTNIWLLFKRLEQDANSRNRIRYVAGVGAAGDRPVTGAVLGRGMQQRILLGYRYVMAHYEPGDKVFIFGFSRGAHQARALAGFLAYSGIPVDKSLGKKAAKKLIKLTKTKNDTDYLEQWEQWTAGAKPVLADEIQSNLGIKVQPVEVEFLGLWDTVPGSSFKDFGACKELPNNKDGDRYKSDSYPTIRQIVHAMSADEKRSKFKPIRVCEPINPQVTSVDEKWFAGAHSDVGGGYNVAADDRLANISLNWMVSHLQQHYTFQSPFQPWQENALALTHWSLGDKGGVGSDYEDRDIPSDRTSFHPSYFQRRQSGTSKILICDEVRTVDYPVNWRLICEQDCC